MEKRTEGAWIIHHAKKINNFQDTSDFGEIEIAGKCGIFLSNLAASDEESTLDKHKVAAIATASNIKPIELAAVKAALQDAQLIETSKGGGLSVLGITSSSVLSHTADLFNDVTTDNFQKASLELANIISEKPLGELFLREYISDNYKLDTAKTERLFNQAEDKSLIDFEVLEKKDKVYFNGNLFRKEDIAKTNKILSSLQPEDVKKVSELDNILSNEGCVLLDTATTILGTQLLEKFQSIGMYDFNEVSNDKHTTFFLTKPSSFSKFGNPFEDDALDLAKSFIASLFYGMKLSHDRRGRIKGNAMLVNTLKKLLRGEWVGPCTAIGQDYQILEINRVVKLEPSSRGMYHMRLLKMDVGRLALDVLQKGDLAEESTLELNIGSSNVSSYSGPEENRVKTRKKKKGNVKLDIGDLLRTIRG